MEQNSVVLNMDLLPKCGTIVDIIVFSTDVHYLVCEVLLTDKFCHHFHAIQAQKCQPVKHVCVKQSELYDHSVLFSYTIPTHPGLYFIPLKYQLIENV